MNIADSLPIAYRVRVTDQSGVVQYEQMFHNRLDFDAKEAAMRNSERMVKLNLFPNCMVTVDEFTFEDLKR